MIAGLQGDWAELLAEEIEKPYLQNLLALLAREYEQANVYPAASQICRALQVTSFANTRVLILGQDPYHQPGQADGLSFSVPQGVKLPPSLRNIGTELQNDLGCASLAHGCLASWAEQGVLLLNTVLSVRDSEPHSHRHLGWDRFTDAIIMRLNRKPSSVVFILWGKEAQAKCQLIDAPQHRIISSAHPSPLSAYRGFHGSKPFSRANAYLRDSQQSEIDWCIKTSD